MLDGQVDPIMDAQQLVFFVHHSLIDLVEDPPFEEMALDRQVVLALSPMHFLFLHHLEVLFLFYNI